MVAGEPGPRANGGRRGCSRIFPERYYPAIDKGPTGRANQTRLSHSYQVTKLRHNSKWDLGSSQGFACRVDVLDSPIAKKLGALVNVWNARGFKAHQPGTGCVGCNRI